MSEETTQKVIGIIAEQAMLDPSDVKLTSTPDDLGLDSLALRSDDQDPDESLGGGFRRRGPRVRGGSGAFGGGRLALGGQLD